MIFNTVGKIHDGCFPVTIRTETMKINIYSVDKMVYGVEIGGGTIEAETSIMNFANSIKNHGYYMYTSPRSKRKTALPWHAITAIEQAETIEDFPYESKERINE